MVDAIPDISSPRQRIVITAVLSAIVALLYGVPAFALFPVGLVDGPAWPGAVTASGLTIVAVAGVVQIVAMLRATVTGHSDLAAKIGYPMLGVAWLLFSWALLLLPLRLVLALTGVEAAPRSRIVAITLVAVVVGLTAVGLREAFRLPRVRRQDVTIARLPAALDGLTIAVLADTHFDAYRRPGWSHRLVELVNSLQPDVVVHAGDLADGSVDQRRDQVDALAEVVASDRVYIAGNHEYYSDAPSWLRHMEELGWTVLVNAHHRVERAGTDLVVAGIDDPTGTGLSGHGPDLDAALAGVPADAPVVLLAHQPLEVRRAVARAAAGQSPVDLQISGHSHGGQIWPFHYLVRTQQKALQGLSRHGEVQLWTTRGAGFWGPPLRVFAPSEVSLLTLRTRGGGTTVSAG